MMNRPFTILNWYLVTASSPDSALNSPKISHRIEQRAHLFFDCISMSTSVEVDSQLSGNLSDFIEEISKHPGQ
jgi:hypothetical protein